MSTSSYNRGVQCSQLSQLVPYTTVLAWRVLPNAIKINKQNITRYLAPTTAEYIDLSTGEIIAAADLKRDPRVPPQLYVGEIMLLRQALMNSLRKEVRDFAHFVLQFRNNRRGVTPEVDTLVNWYACLQKKRASNVRRYVDILKNVGLLAGASLLSPLFQRTGKNLSTKDHLSEDMVARARFLVLRMKGT